jgi:UDP-GlcNAc:undecaprenyl-phosphate/decaprenyl-phosphate GlcNAc-1-phosphate transferase
LFKQGFIDGTNIGPLVAIIAVGVCLGFLPFNWHPSKIIMGDAGALFLGLLLAVPTITIGGRTDHAFSGNTFFFFGPLLIPVLILGVPILDTAFSFVRRLWKRQRWHQADAGHLHHRLMALGHGPRRTVVILWAWTALLSGIALLPTYTNEGNALVPFAGAALLLLLIAWFHPGIRTRRERKERARHPTAHPTDEVVNLAERRRQRA